MECKTKGKQGRKPPCRFHLHSFPHHFPWGVPLSLPPLLLNLSFLLASPIYLPFPAGPDGRESTCKAGDLGSIPGLGRPPGRRHSNPLHYSSLENPHRQRILAGYSPWGCKESDTTEQLSRAHTSIPTPFLPLFSCTLWCTLSFILAMPFSP